MTSNSKNNKVSNCSCLTYCENLLYVVVYYKSERQKEEFVLVTSAFVFYIGYNLDI